jgi:hypothetical protein
MVGILFLILAGLAALAFLVVVFRRKQMPAPLRGILIIAAIAIVFYVVWILTTLAGTVAR